MPPDKLKSKGLQSGNEHSGITLIAARAVSCQAGPPLHSWHLTSRWLAFALPDGIARRDGLAQDAIFMIDRINLDTVEEAWVCRALAGALHAIEGLPHCCGSVAQVAARRCRRQPQ